jgi:DNA-binding Lrp family transcriptional regulator
LWREGLMDRLDGIDEQILVELAQHARATFAEIGERVRLSAPAVKRRVDRMLDSGVIRGFTTVIDRNAVGWNTEAYVQVFCQGRISPEQLRRSWVDIPEVVSAATVTGPADAILRVLARDMQHLEDALERIRTSADIERSESIVVLSNLIDRPRAQG